MLAKLARRACALPKGVPGYLPLVRRTRSRSLAIVMYHGVTSRPPEVFNWCQLEAARFEEQVRYLAGEYRVISLAEAIDGLSGRAPLPDHAAVLTFDDGFRNVFTTAFPILERLQVPSTVFLVTSVIGTHQPAWPERVYHALASAPAESAGFGAARWSLATPRHRAAAYGDAFERFRAMGNREKEERLGEFLRAFDPPAIAPDSPLATMGWDEIEQLARTGLVTFGSHTHTHPILSRCTPEEQREELRLSRDILRERLGRADLFAYPNGSRSDFDATTRRWLVELGYRCGLATVPGLNREGADLYGLRRVNVGADTTFPQFQLRMIGL
jgi:peptidoglycan/xylan/chitin deacetylase (PgdA/CDA1 family)